MHRKRKPESESWLWAKIVTIPACLIVYWSLLFINTAAGNAWTIWAVCGSYGLLVAWLYSVWRLLHLAAWKRDRAIAEELKDQTQGFTFRDEEVPEDFFTWPVEFHGRGSEALTEHGTEMLRQFEAEQAARIQPYAGILELLTHPDLFGGRHELTETIPEIPKADG